MIIELLDVPTPADAVSIASDPVRIELSELSAIFVDGVEVETLSMEAPDGEVLSWTRTEQRVELIVEWNDFAAKRRHTRAYRFVCR